MNKAAGENDGKNKLYIEPSSCCNLNCKMCFRNSWFEESIADMSDKTVSNVLELLKCDVCNSVFFGGMGEPLKHKDIFSMVAVATAYGKNAELITNATLLNANAVERLRDSGLDTLWVSMDGFSKESYENVRRGSLYDKIIENLEYFNKNRGTVKLGFTFVMMEENLSELEKINDFADRFGADFINLSHMIPSEPMKESNSIYKLPYRVDKMYRFDKNEKVEKPFDFCPFVNEGSCFIRQDGEVTACMQLLHNSYTYLYEEKRKVFSHSFGNINEMRLEDIWESEKYSAFRNRVLNFDFPCCTVCLGCDDRKENVTDCMYNESPTCGACLWSQGFIRCP